MPKRAVSFADDAQNFKREKLDEKSLLDKNLGLEDDGNVKKNEDVEDERKKHHTLDSDEEEEEDHKRLDMDQVEGQEDTNMDFDGSIKITAFNMKEDLEEGHFDETGNFIFEKKEKDIQDAWLDGIDWTTVKRKAGKQWEGDEKKEDEEDEEMLNTSNQQLGDDRKKEIFERLLAILKPNQTIAKALTQLKKSKGLSAAEERKLRWAAKKAGKPLEDSDSQKETKELSGLADELITAGFMDAYEWHKEKIDFMLSRLGKTAVDDLDMFSDEPAAEVAPTTSADLESEKVLWEYKKDDQENTPIQGPFTSEQMLEKQEKGELEAKGLARRVSTAKFNPTARIDFELYC